MTREEEFYGAILAAINGADHTCPEPVWRHEEFFKAIDDALSSGGGRGTGSGVLVVHETVSGNTHTLDKTWKEIADVGFAALYIDDTSIQGFPTMIFSLDRINDSGGNYVVRFGSLEGTTTFNTNTETGYPSYTSESGDEI